MNRLSAYRAWKSRPSKLERYRAFLRRKAVLAPTQGFAVLDEEVTDSQKPHQRVLTQWACAGGNRAIFALFGLGKTRIQLDIMRLCLLKTEATHALITAPLGVRREFFKDAEAMGIPLRFIRSDAEIAEPGIYLTNFESVREGKVTPARFGAATLDEASVLRGFGGSKTFREFMRLYDAVPHRYVATAVPDPNDHIELLAYAAFLGIMDVGQAKTRFFKRNSEKADELTLHPHKEREFWLWVASWAVFLQYPSQLGFSDEGYELPEMDVRWHEVPVDHAGSPVEGSGQHTMFRGQAKGVVEASREKRDTIPSRIAKVQEIIDTDPDDHFLIWHDLEAERHAIEKAIPDVVTVYGSQDLEGREAAVADFAEGRSERLATKPVMYGSGANFQYHCHREIFAGIGFKFNEFIQGIYRVNRFGQKHTVRIDIVYAESEREVRRDLLDKWAQHEETVRKMSEIIAEYGLNHADMMKELARSIGVERVEVTGENYRLINNDAVEEAMAMPDASVQMVLTSIPFSTQYEYTPSYNDFGHTDSNEHFFEQMDFLIPELLRVLEPGRLAAIHVKDRIVPMGLTGLGSTTAYPFHAHVIFAFQKHGFAYMGMKTIVTDVVRENNQTYRLSWSEQLKDGTKMGVGMPEYLLIFRRPPSDTINSYADTPVVKNPPQSLNKEGGLMPFKRKAPQAPGTGYSLARWQVDAHAFTRSSGDRLLTPEELLDLDHAAMFKLFRDYSLSSVYDFEHHVRLGEALAAKMLLPVTFMLLQPQSWHPDVWSDITRMLTLNGAQHAAGREMHLCPLQFDIVDRAIEQWTMEGETVYDPFGGLMTVPYRALKLKRKGLATELNTGYFLDGVKYCESAEREMNMPTLFDTLPAAEEAVA